MHRLVQNLDVFIKAASGELGFQIGELLREVFSGGPSISLSVKEDQICSILQTTFVNGRDNCTSSNSVLLDALSELLLVRKTTGWLIASIYHPASYNLQLLLLLFCNIFIFAFVAVFDVVDEGLKSSS